MLTEQPILITSIKTFVQLTKHRIVSFNGNHSSSAPLGVCKADTKPNSYAPIITHGIAMVEAGDSIFKGEKVGPDSLGRAVPDPFYNVCIGKALDGAMGAGEIIRVVLNQTS